MYTFTFRISQNKNTFARVCSEVTVQAPDYYDQATITKTNNWFCLLEIVCRFWPMPVMPPCGRSFSFDEPFSPWELYYAVKHGGMYFEVETDYPGDLTKWPPQEEDELVVEVVGIDEETGRRIILPPHRKNPYILY